MAQVGTDADTGDGQLAEGEHVTVAVTRLLVAFNKNMDSTDAGTVGNYHLLREGSAVDLVDSVDFNSGASITTLNINGGMPLPPGNYTFTVSGTIRDTLGNSIGADFVRHFVIEPYLVFLPLVIR